jgi:hypothetical protein
VAQIRRVVLFGKLNSVVYKALEAATVFCKLRGNHYVELQHWIYQLHQVPNSDLTSIYAHFSVDRAALERDLTVALDRLPQGATSISDFSPNLEAAVERGWVYTSLLFRASSIRAGHLLFALLNTQSLSAALTSISREFRKINVDALGDRFDEIVRDSLEENSLAQDGTSANDPSSNSTRDIFISYRRSESQHITGRIFDYLEREFGGSRLFKDVDSIPVGVKDFSKEIESQLISSKLMLVVVGPTWLTVRDETGRRRIDMKDDFVRIEVKWGLDSQIPVIPLLFDDAPMPTLGSLPPALKAFSRCQSLPVRPDPDFRNDMNRLITICRKYLASQVLGG